MQLLPTNKKAKSSQTMDRHLTDLEDSDTDDRFISQRALTHQSNPPKLLSSKESSSNSIKSSGSKLIFSSHLFANRPDSFLPAKKATPEAYPDFHFFDDSDMRDAEAATKAYCLDRVVSPKNSGRHQTLKSITEKDDDKMMSCSSYDPAVGGVGRSATECKEGKGMYKTAKNSPTNSITQKKHRTIDHMIGQPLEKPITMDYSVYKALNTPAGASRRSYSPLSILSKSPSRLSKNSRQKTPPGSKRVKFAPNLLMLVYDRHKGL